MSVYDREKEIARTRERREERKGERAGGYNGEEERQRARARARYRVHACASEEIAREALVCMHLVASLVLHKLSLSDAFKPMHIYMCLQIRSSQ